MLDLSTLGSAALTKTVVINESEVTLGFCKPDHFMLLDLDRDAAPLRRRMEAKENPRSEDVFPLLKFLDAHVVDVSGVKLGKKKIAKWSDIPEDTRITLLRQISVSDFWEIYGEVVQLGRLKAPEKND